jgi:hypothetical protein
MKVCKVEACENTLKDSDKHDHCKNCRANFYYWGKKRKRPAEVLYRRARLRLFNDRLSLVMEERGIDDE